MFINFFCPCGKKLKAPANAVGKKGKCPGCGANFLVPQTSSSAPVSTLVQPQMARPTSPNAPVLNKQTVPATTSPKPQTTRQALAPKGETTGSPQLPKTADGRPPKCTVCEYRVEQIEYNKTTILYCETCSFYIAPYETMIHIIRNPETAPDPKLAVKLKILLDARLPAQKGETSSKKCYYCQSPLICSHYQRIPTLLVEQCPKGCMVLAALPNFKKMQALEKMGISWNSNDPPFPKSR